ncbi:hypothetical protein PVAP13_1NG120338 [Panicum virgatum]|uniref:BED-type domain-containing protein n=1 Tax=Panicum virgatum TaxID=38727 RepID=A0A8T0WRG6_PANVG|nr:hypothetical protein PVAP13_1NG120338 [Panicum virgatum]
MDVQIDEHNVAPATRAPEVVVVDDQDQEDEEDKDQVHLTGNRKKKCTSDVWNYFTKKIEIVEVDGKQYEQLWGYCDFPKCKQRYRAEGIHGTTRFKNHLRSAHGIVKGQQQLNVDSRIVGSIVNDLDVETLSISMANKLKVEDKNKEGDEEQNEDGDMESDPDIMNDEDEL